MMLRPVYAALRPVPPGLDGAGAPIIMDQQFDSVTLVSEGHEWVVLFRQ